MRNKEKRYLRGMYLACIWLLSQMWGMYWACIGCYHRCEGCIGLHLYVIRDMQIWLAFGLMWVMRWLAFGWYQRCEGCIGLHLAVITDVRDALACIGCYHRCEGCIGLHRLLSQMWGMHWLAIGCDLITDVRDAFGLHLAVITDVKDTLACIWLLSQMWGIHWDCIWMLSEICIWLALAVIRDVRDALACIWLLSEIWVMHWLVLGCYERCGWVRLRHSALVAGNSKYSYTFPQIFQAKAHTRRIFLDLQGKVTHAVLLFDLADWILWRPGRTGVIWGLAFYHNWG
jgi:hypothetical protein